MHIADTELKMLGANGIVGGGIPIAIGAGFSCKMRNKGEVTLCFFGDGAANNGVFHEALNMTAIFKLPVIFICENNLYAISMCSLDSVACEDVGKRSCAYDIPGYIIEGSDTIEVYNTVKKAVKHAREGKGPSLIEAKTYRFYGHHPNDPAEYRTKEEADFYKKEKDPVVLFKDVLVRDKTMTKKDIEKMEADVLKEVEGSYDFAVNSPEPDLDRFLEEVKAI
jgi:TPP-dependent pyruvate/acetoin dehydrogenase alpha subunit